MMWTDEAEDLVREPLIQLRDKKSYRQMEQSFKACRYRGLGNKCIKGIRKHKLTRKRQDEYRLKRKESVRPEQQELAGKTRVLAVGGKDLMTGCREQGCPGPACAG